MYVALNTPLDTDVLSMVLSFIKNNLQLMKPAEKNMIHPFVMCLNKEIKNTCHIMWY